MIYSMQEKEVNEQNNFSGQEIQTQEYSKKVYDQFSDQQIAPVEAEDRRLECQVIGFTTSTILAIIWLIIIVISVYISLLVSFEGITKGPPTDADKAKSMRCERAAMFCLIFGVLGNLLNSVFHIIVCVPGYTSGSPKWTKFIPAGLGTFFYCSGLDYRNI